MNRTMLYLLSVVVVSASSQRSLPEFAHDSMRALMDRRGGKASVQSRQFLCCETFQLDLDQKLIVLI